MASDEESMFILDLNAELKRKIRSKSTKTESKKVRQLKKKRGQQKEHNIKVAAPYKRKQRKILKELRYKRGEQAKKQRNKARKNLENPPVKFRKYDLSKIDKQASKITDNEAYYTVSDGFGSDFVIKAKDIVKRENLALYVLQKFKKDVQKEIPRIKKTTDFKRSSKRKQQRILYGLKKLLMKIDFNIDLVNKGIKKYEDADEELTQTDPPILIDFTNGKLIIQG